ncbi:MAG: response regulator transcription factor, partial [Candidatus Neomarinimicrobiota bacterium]
VKQTAANNLIDAIRAVSNDQVYFSPAVSKVMVEAYRQQTASSGSSEAPDKLTRRERQILHLVAEGHTSRKIAEKLHLAPSTVETHRANIMAKLNIHDVASLVRYALKNNI